MRQVTRELFEIVEEKMSARRRVHRSTNNGLRENNNGESIEQQYGTVPHGTFCVLRRPLPAASSEMITFCCLQIVADSAVEAQAVQRAPLPSPLWGGSPSEARSA